MQSSGEDGQGGFLIRGSRWERGACGDCGDISSL